MGRADESQPCLYLAYRFSNDQQFFGDKDVGLKPNDSAYLDFLFLKGVGKSMYLKIDHGSNGTIDETSGAKEPTGPLNLLGNQFNL